MTTVDADRERVFVELYVPAHGKPPFQQFMINKKNAFFVDYVGNYGEIYERNLTPLGIPRGLNALYTKGGLLYAPPLRP